MRSPFFKTYAVYCACSLPLILAGLVAFLAGLPGRANASSLPELKLTIGQTGIYRLSDAQLATALGTQDPGITTNYVDSLIASGGFTLLNQGLPVSWLPGSNNTEILFHAQALQNIYTEYNVYWLVAGNNVAPVSVNGGNPAAVTPNTEYYLATTNIGQSVATNCEYSLGVNPDSNYWYGATVLGLSSHNNSHATSFSLGSLLAATNVMVQVNVSLCGNDSETQEFTLSVGANTLATDSWYGAVPTNFTYTFQSAYLSAGSFTGKAATTTSDWLLGWYQLQYPSWYLAANGSLVCGANSNAVVTIGGFTSANITVLDVTQPSTPLQVNNLNIQSVSGGYEVSFVPAGLTNMYSVCQAGAEQTPLDIEAVTSTGLTNVNNQAAFIIIAPTNFLTASQPLVDYRNAQGLQTKLVSMEAVYNEFNNGIRYPAAISNFLAYAWQNWSVPPKYVLFMGSGTYDYRNLLGLGGNYIPPLMVPAILNGLVASDSQYGQVTGVPGPQISIGRIPATNVTQVAQMIAKIKTYEATQPSGKAVLLSDTNDPSSGDYPADMVAVASALAGSYSEEVILPGTGTNASLMRSDLLADLNNGADLFVYCGHGASTQLGNAGYLQTTDVAALTDTNRSPLMSIITCLCGFFAAPGNTCIAQDLAMGTNNGAIATLAASGLSIDSDVLTLNQNLMLELVSGTPGRLGDFIQQSMSSYNQSSHYTPSALYNLLGDPTLGYVPTILTGSVILDENGNGVQDVGETTGVSPVVIQIYSGGTTLVATVTNSSNGSYGVTNLPPGNYTVVQTLPSGWLATTSTNVSVTLAAGGTTTVDFLDAQPVSIGGRGWLDVNRDGLQDSGEPGLPGVLVTLYETNQVAETITEVTNTVTPDSGIYLFTNLPPGIYEVGFAPPAGSYTLSPQLVGSNTNLNSAASATTGLTYFFTMLSGQSNVSLNSGFEINSSPVSIVALGAYVNQGEAFVTWQTYDEVDMLAFYVTRSAAGSPVQNITPDYVLATGQDLGETYSVPDAGAALPGVYTYTLYGISSNLSVAQLDSVTVQLAPPNVSVSALTISSLTITGGNALLGWTGGQPPYVVEQSATLGAGAVWQAVGPAQTGTQLLVPLTNQASFFRVSGGQ